MTNEAFQQLLQGGVVLLDGATGTNLQQAGMPIGVCPEQWILENRDVMIDLQRRFVEAGSQILYAPTFTGNRLKLAEYGLDDQLVAINQGLVAISKEAAQGKALVAGDMTMTGQQLYPMGELTFDGLVDVYREQAQALYDAGVDLFIVETMMSLQETRACVLAIKEVCDLPIMATLTFEKDGRTLYGTPPEAAVVVLQNLGVDAVGLNCSTGPADMVETVRKMYEYATIPLIAKPNAGLPELDGDKTVYKTTPEEFAQDGRLLIEAGAHIVGGCCGTTPDHIRALHEAVCRLTPKAPHASHHRVLASERQVVEIKLDGSFQVIGERINPFVAAVAACSINSGAYVSEIFRAGIQSVDKGQMEAGRSLGLSWMQTMRYVIMPQAFKHVIPPLGNEFISMTKETSLVSVIGFEELTRRGQLIIAKTYGSFEIWLTVAAIYLVMTLTIARLVSYLERRFATDDRN